MGRGSTRGANGEEADGRGAAVRQAGAEGGRWSGGPTERDRRGEAGGRKLRERGGRRL